MNYISSPPRASRGTLATGGLCALAVTYPTFSGGGFDASSQTTFIALAGLTLAAASLLEIAGNAAGPVPALRSPALLGLLALAAFSMLSALWTITSPGYAIRWGLVIAGYGAVAFASSRVAARTGPWPFAAAILALAIIEAVLGLQAAITHTLPDAQLLAGRWRPGGTFEYQPALALLEVSALPVVARMASMRRAPAIIPASACALVLGAALGISGERLEPAMGLLVILALMIRPPSGFERLAVVAVLVLLATGAGISLSASLGSPSTDRPAQHEQSDFLHGRLHEWKAAIQTWEHRPLLGAGAGSYYVASARYQGTDASLYAHDLPLETAAELGIIGFLACIAIYLGSIRALLQARGTEALVLLGPLCAFFLASNLLDWTWHLAGLGAIWAAGLGALLAAVRLPAQNQERKQ